METSLIRSINNTSSARGIQQHWRKKRLIKE